MAFDRFLIAPINTGLQTDIKSWLLPDDAFEFLENAYVFRGRVRKRFGTILMGATQANSRLRISLGNNTNAAMNLPANTAAHTPQLAIGQIFSLGTDFFTVYQLGNGVATLTTNPAVTALISSTATPNTITFTGGAILPVYWYPSLPVMGIGQYEIGAVNNHPTYAFDTEFAYVFVGGAWERSGAAIWHGTDLNFFWITNWQGVAGNPVLFVTNFNATVGAPGANDDPIWWFDGTTWTAGTGNNAFYFLPNGGLIHTGPYVKTARIIVPFKNRLVLLNTVENANGGGAGVNTAYVNRARYSFNGSPFARNAWYEPNQTDASGGVVNNDNIAAGAGFIDAATEEQIISAEFIKDRLIVYFERSTWELAYTGNEILPFIWNKLNTELGSQSTFSTIPFDKEVLTIGNSGIHACNGSNVVRVDQKIPDKVFEFETDNNAPSRTVGIRDYYVEVSMWTFVSVLEQTTQTYPNRVLIYNYKNGSWAVNDDCFTFFGYFEQQTDTTWASSAPLIWTQANETWISGVLQANQRQILGGNQEGFVLRINQDVNRNAPSLSITNIAYAATGILTLTIINHNLVAVPTQFPNDNDFVLIENIAGDAATALFLNGSIFPVYFVVDANTIQINTFGGLTAGAYTGGGTAARVSNIQITTKRFNPYVGENTNVYLAKVDFAVKKTGSVSEGVVVDGGAITVDYYPSSTEVEMIQAGVATGSIMGSSVLETSPYDPNLYPLEQYQSLLWHPIYFQTVAEFVQLDMYFTADQMINPNISLAPFELEAMCLFTARSGRLQ